MHGNRQLSEGFTHKKTSITTNDCRHGGRMEWAKNGTDIDSAYCKVSRSPQKKKAGKKERSAPAQRTLMSSDEKKMTVESV